MKTPKILFLALLLLCGCVAQVVRTPIELTAANQQEARRYITVYPVTIKLDSGYERRINAGVEFVEIGIISFGKVFRPTKTVFTVEGAHMHEAYLVLNNERIVGFYLPVEKAFSPLSQPVVLSIKEGSL